MEGKHHIRPALTRKGAVGAGLSFEGPADKPKISAVKEFVDSYSSMKFFPAERERQAARAQKFD